MKTVFTCVNEDPARVSQQDFEDVVAANALQQSEDVAPTLEIDPPAVVAAPPDCHAAPDSVREIFVYLRPSTPSDGQGAVAYHWVNPDSGKPECVVLTDVVATLPGVFLDNLSTAMGHEITEATKDLFADEWVDLPDGRQEAREECDRCQSASYPKTVTRADGSQTIVQVTDFLTDDAWVVDKPTGEKCDFMDLIPRDQPRAILPDKGDGKGGGYAAIRNKDGTIVNVEGDKKAAMRYSHKKMQRIGASLE